MRFYHGILLLFYFFLLTSQAKSQCFNGSPSGAPFFETYIPECNGIDVETIDDFIETTEYNNVDLEAGVDYTFSTSDPSLFITIAQDGASVSLATGTGSVVYTPTGNETIRFFSHANSSCDNAPGFHSRFVFCNNPDCPGLGNFGDTCDDGSPNTVEDQVTSSCTCQGIPIIANDTPCGAFEIECGETLNDQTVAGAATIVNGNCSGDDNPDVYFSFEADGVSKYTLTLSDDAPGTSDSFSGDFQLFTGSSCSDLSPIPGCLFQFSNSGGAELFSGTYPAGTYYLSVSRRIFPSAPSREFNLSLECEIPDCPGVGNIGEECTDIQGFLFGGVIDANCNCVGSIADECGGVSSFLECGESVIGTTEGAGIGSVVPEGCFYFEDEPIDAWYAFEADGTQSYILNLTDGPSNNFDFSEMHVYSDSCSSLTEVDCSFQSGSSDPSITLVSPSAGTYYVQIYSIFNSAFGNEFELSLICTSACLAPFPQVEESSLVSVVGSSPPLILLSWQPQPNQIGCQVQVRLASTGSILGSQIVGGASANSLNVPPSVLAPGTDYEWRVRCGCSQSPLIAGAFSAWSPFTSPGGPIISSSPNPTSGSSNVEFNIAKEGHTTLEVFDMSGRLVNAIFSGVSQPDVDYRFEFDGSSLPNGVYLYRLTTENEVVNEKFMIAR
ncbi:MAG: T9SS type A sorting domain-containing protein [Bacteroidota bacterium]